MKKFLLTAIVCFAAGSFAFAQSPATGSKAWNDLNAQRNSNPPSPQNGNATLGTIFDTTMCGLNYTQASLKLGQRLNPTGVAQPAPFPIANIPFCAQIVKAYLWCAGSGNGIAATATITNPTGTTQSFPMTMAGQDQDMCWGYSGSYVYRADVTSIINGNGNYIVSGIPTNPPGPSNDMDGGTLMIIYKDVAASYTGSIHINDGAVTMVGTSTTQNISGFNSCANSTSAKGFMIVADLQNIGTQFSFNGGAPFSVTEDWYNFISQSTSITQSQSSYSFDVISSGDCYLIAMAGLYTQTTCNTCTPVSGILTITNPSTTAATCTNNGSATIAVTGGSGNYTITWNTNPIQNGLTANNLPPGNYYVTVVDSTAGACGAISINIPYTGPVLTTTTTPVTCSSLGSATVSVTGGTAPYTYSWAPTGGNSPTANNLSAGIYTVSVTDNTGCTVSANAIITSTANLIVNTIATPDSCPSPTGSVSVFATGGQPPYSYLWMPGNYTSSSVSNLPAGSYTVTVTDGAGCVISAMATITVSTVGVNVWINGSGNIPCGGSVQLFANANYSPATFLWSPSTYLSNPNIPNPICSPLGTITYTVTATTACGTGSTTFNVSIAGTNPFNEEICFVSVDTALNKNVIIWERLNSPPAGSYNIYRETSTSGVYALIGNQPLSQFSTFTDLTSNPLNMANRYKIATADSCGVESDTSFHHRTLFLQVSPSLPTGFNLAWTAYEGLPVATYYIYRGNNPGNLTLLAAVASTIFNWTDYNPPIGQLYYMVLAVHPFGGCNPSLRLSNPLNPASVIGSLSNLGPVVYSGMDENNLLKNSFVITPNPGNGNFQVSLSLTHTQEIQLTVFDNLGRCVFAQQEHASAGNFSASMNLSSLSSGVYFVQVKTENGVATKRLVVD